MMDEMDMFVASMPANICLLCSNAIPVGEELCAYCDSGVRDAIERSEGSDWAQNGPQAPVTH